ncbi:MAG: DNA ligase D [Methylovirgula sp.]|jgi:bifunctional non-homologous end joining protein LigD
MALETYRQKRDFHKTSEPRGRTGPKNDNLFVIQKHAARRLHYDFRLALDGVLKSWAVARGPSLVPGEKRLAVHVEDHPLDYGDFEGTIPKGEYGGGNVILWDRGHWTPVGDPRKGLAKGHLDFDLDGEKLHGRWHLVRMRAKPREKRDNWLLIKADDAAARGPKDPDILEEQPNSVKTGRSVEALTGEAPGWSSKTGRIDNTKKKAKPNGAEAQAKPPEPSKLKGAKKAVMPEFVEPALATLEKKAPSGARWIHEIKYDGYRVEARIDKGRVKLLTRSGLDWTRKFGKTLVEAFQALPVKSALIDGEVIVENNAGASDFSALQQALSEGQAKKFLYYAFDLLYLDGYDLRELPLLSRKETLEQLLKSARDPLRYSAHFVEDGELIRRHACRLSLEGIVSKVASAPYHSGRGKDWIKSKCSERQEFVIAGFVPSTTTRKAIGSLVLGYYDKKGALLHAGRVGTGFTAAVAADLYKKLEKIRVAKGPFARPLTTEQAQQVTYVKPQYVAEIEFRGWTADQSLRHAAFRGLREDKPAEEVVREDAPAKEAATPKISSKTSITLTHPDRLYWPDAGVTKAGLADYYADVWKHIAPFIVARPLALVRCPGGIKEPCFFQKHAWKGLSGSIHQIKDPKEKAEEPILYIDDLDGLIALVQGGVLEIHPWGSALATLEQPDRIIMDLDPGEGVAWRDVIAAAKDVKQRFADFGLASFVKTTGGKGLHVVAPLKPSAGWEEVKNFSRDIAQSMAADSPESYVATITKSKRHGKILIDYLRNGRGATAVAPYSTRARPGAPVSMPLGWSELTPEIGPAYFTLANAPARLAALSKDPWGDFQKLAKSLPSSKAKKVRATAKPAKTKSTTTKSTKKKTAKPKLSSARAR